MRWKPIAFGALIFVVGVGIAFLVPETWVFRSDHGTHEHAEEGAGWACPMFCVVMDKKPADEKCPVCGMELGLVSSETALSKHEQAMIGLAPHALEEVPLVHELVLYGEVTWDPNRVEVVSARSAGWVERLVRRVPLEEVKAGDVLYELYSPDLYEAQQELIASRDRPELRDAARERLRLLGLDDEAIDSVQDSKSPKRRVPRRSPRDGVVADLSIDEGAHVARGAKVLGIADPATVWIQFEVFESELAWLSTGMEIELNDVALGDKPVRGRIVFVDPVVDRMSRTARVRVEIENRRRADGQWALLPGQRMKATAKVGLGFDGYPVRKDGARAELMALPRSSVLRTGRRSVVYVLYDRSQSDPFIFDAATLPETVGYVMIEVEVGPLAQHADRERRDEYFPLIRVVPGGDPLAPGRLRPGMIVASEGAFLIDSQAQLSGRPSLFHPQGRSGPAPTGHENH